MAFGARHPAGSARVHAENDTNEMNTILDHEVSNVATESGAMSSLHGESDLVIHAEELLAQDNPSLQRAAIHLLVEQCKGDARAPKVLARIAREHARPQTRGEAVQAMSRCRDADSVQAAISVLQGDGDAGVRLRAASTLGTMGDASARPALEAAIKDSHESVRATAMRALKKL